MIILGILLILIGMFLMWESHKPEHHLFILLYSTGFIISFFGGVLLSWGIYGY